MKADVAGDVAQDADGMLYVAGRAYHAVGSDALVRKLDPSGNEVAKFVGPSNSMVGKLHVDIDVDGSVYVGSSDEPLMEEPARALVYKHDADGGLVWTFMQGGELFTGSYNIHGLAARDGHLFVVGKRGVEEQAPAYLQRLDPADGAVIWTKEFPAGTIAELSLAIEPGGDPLLGGTVRDPDDGYVPFVARHAAADGSEVWRRTHGDGRETHLFGIALNAGGDIAVAGYVVNPMEGVQDFSWNDMVTMRLTPDGELVWRDEVDTAMDRDVASDVAWSPSGEIYVAGHVTAGADPISAFVARYEGDGERCWTSIHDGFSSADALVVSGTQVVSVGGVVIGQDPDDQLIRAFEP